MNKPKTKSIKVPRLRDKNGRFRKRGSKGNKTPRKPKNKTPRKPNNKTPRKPKNKTPRKAKNKKSKTPKKAKKNVTFSKDLVEKRSALPVAYGHVYSDECGYCREMQPEWNTLKENVGNKVTLCDIDKNHTENVRQFNEKYDSSLNFEGFPTVFKLMSRHSPVEYYDQYYKNEKDKYEKNLTSIEPKPYRSAESMRVWILGG